MPMVKTVKVWRKIAFTLNQNLLNSNILFKEVYYLETSPRAHRVILYTKTDRLEFTASLEEVFKQEPRLLHCHRSFLINPANVVHLDKKEKLLFFPNGGSCLIARYKVREVSEAINNLH